MNNISKKMRPPDAARYLGISESTLAKWRCQDSSGPPYIKLGPRIVIYDQAELDAWMRGRSRRSTSGPPSVLRLLKYRTEGSVSPFSGRQSTSAHATSDQPKSRSHETQSKPKCDE